MNREEWLNLAINELRLNVLEPAAIKWPDDFSPRVSCGWPPQRALSEKKRTIGVCHKREQSKSNKNEIFISPAINDSIEVLATELHEVIHALDNCKSHHKGFFLITMKKIGLEGKPTQTHAGEGLIVRLNGIIDKIGPYPHSELVISSLTKKQSTRMVKAECPECGYVIRTTRKWIEEAGLPVCPCGTRFALPGDIIDPGDQEGE